MKDMPITMESDGWMGQTGGYAKDMTLRQYIAIQTMKALITSRHTDYEIGWYDEERVAESSYKMADAMLQAGND